MVFREVDKAQRALEAMKMRWYNDILMHAPSPHKRAFSLLELSIVLAVISVLLGGVLNIAAQMTRDKKQAELTMKMDAIEAALIGFRKANNRLPCPADGSLAISDANFSKEAATPGTCTGGTPAASFSNGNLVGGVVPTRTLGLPDEFTFDPWGGRFTYALGKEMTATGAFITYSPTATLATPLTIKTASIGTTISSAALAVVVSHGQNGHGAFQLSGVRKNGGSTNAEEQKNCHCTAAAVADTFDATFIQKKATDSGLDSYDDITRYYKRSDFLNASDILTEK
ncbi:MAG: type II secretion system protein [Alphaproteobacteria bacterium]|nr:type II secretion system protein [Alphaproteobacteria bacterium]